MASQWPRLKHMISGVAPIEFQIRFRTLPLPAPQISGNRWVRRCLAGPVAESRAVFLRSSGRDSNPRYWLGGLWNAFQSREIHLALMKIDLCCTPYTELPRRQGFPHRTDFATSDVVTKLHNRYRRFESLHLRHPVRFFIRSSDALRRSSRAGCVRRCVEFEAARGYCSIISARMLTLPRLLRVADLLQARDCQIQIRSCRESSPTTASS
jgi:hypothetical protein